MKTLKTRPMSTLLLAVLTFGMAMVTVVGQLAAQQPQSECHCNANACATTNPPPPTDPCPDTHVTGCQCTALGGPWQVATGMNRGCVRDGGGCCPGGDPCWNDCVNTCYVVTYNNIACNIPTENHPCGYCAAGA